MSTYIEFVKKHMKSRGSKSAKEQMKAIGKMWQESKGKGSMKKASPTKKKSPAAKKMAMKRLTVSKLKSISSPSSKKKTEKRSRQGPAMHAKDGVGMGAVKGNDGNMWIVSAPNKNGSVHWVKYRM